MENHSPEHIILSAFELTSSHASSQSVANFLRRRCARNFAGHQCRRLQIYHAEAQNKVYEFFVSECEPSKSVDFDDPCRWCGNPPGLG